MRGVYRGVVSFDPPAPPTTSAAETGAPGGWRTILFVTWILTLGALVAVAVSSRTIGRPVWWLGPSVNPAHPLAVMIPVAIVVCPLVVAVRHPRRMGVVGIASAVALAATSIPDVSDKPGVAIAVLTVAVAALGGSVAVFMAARHYR